METLDLFKYEEQEGKKYLVYENEKDEALDNFTLEMLSNNKIDGAAPFSCIQMDRSVIMKYNVTGLETLQTKFSAPVGKKTFLGILESLADALIRAEDYMLDISSYVLQERFIYYNPADLKISMIVLPVYRDAERVDIFLKRMLFDVQYDRNDDCGYVAAFMNFLGSESTFSMHSFRNQIIELKKAPASEPNGKQKKTADDSQQISERISFSEQAAEGLQAGMFSDCHQGKHAMPNVHHSVKIRENPIKDYISHEKEKQENLQILFSDTAEEEIKKKKRGIFSKKEKSEKKEKRWFLGKKKEKNGESTAQIDDSVKSPLGGIAIPGMDLLGKLQTERKGEDLKKNISIQRQQIPIPVQYVNVSQQPAEQQDFGETVYTEEEAEAPTVFEEVKGQSRQKFILYRCSTRETFEIKGDIVRVGRSPSISEICISGNRGVGRVHAVLYVRDGQVYIADNNSKNKTFVDGEELKPGDQPTMLLSGSKIWLGTEELEFRISS